VTAYGDSLPDGAEFFASGGASSEQDARDDLSGGLLTEGETFSVTFSEPGTYEYFCIPHEQVGMTGTIIVEE
jgi:plastocyanin